MKSLRQRLLPIFPPCPLHSFTQPSTLMQKSKTRQTTEASTVKTKVASRPGRNANLHTRAQNGEVHRSDLIESAVGQINAMALTLKQTAQQAESLALSGEETASSVNEMVASIEQVTSGGVQVATAAAQTSQAI